MNNSTTIPEKKASATRRLGYCAKNKARKRMVAITLTIKPNQPKKLGVVAVIINTLIDPTKLSKIKPAVVANK